MCIWRCYFSKFVWKLKFSTCFPLMKILCLPDFVRWYVFRFSELLIPIINLYLIPIIGIRMKIFLIMWLGLLLSVTWKILEIVGKFQIFRKFLEEHAQIYVWVVVCIKSTLEKINVRELFFSYFASHIIFLNIVMNDMIPNILHFPFHDFHK